MAKYESTVQTVIGARNELTAELQRAEREMREQAGRERQRTQEAERMARERARVEHELRDRALRAQGQHLQADLLQVRQNFQQRIEAARAANQTELADRLETLRQMREAEIRTAHESARARERTAHHSQAVVRSVQGLAGRIAGMGSLMFLVRSLGSMADELARVRDEGKGAAGAMRAVATNLPVFREGFRLGEGLRELIFGEMAEVRRLEESAERMREFGREQEARLKRISELRGDTLDAMQQMREQQNLMAIGDDDERRRAEMLLAHERERRELQAQINQELEREMRRRGQAGMDPLEAFEAEHIRLLQQRVDLHQKLTDQQVAAFDRRQRELAEERRRLEQLASEREDALERERELTERIGRARGRTQAPGLPQLDQERFLTGVRQETQQQDRAVLAVQQRQLAGDRQRLAELQAIRRGIEETARAIRDGTIVAIQEDI